MRMGQVLVFDTTLRDGMKSPGTILTSGEKFRIAKQLVRLQVDVLEAGFPAASEEQYLLVERIARELNGPVVSVLARATNPRDFEIAWRAVKSSAKPRLHTFVPVSREYRRHFLKKTADQALDLGVSAVQMAKQYVSDVEFSLVDAFRADPEEVVQLVLAVIEAGATTVNLADTVGCAVPTDVERLFRYLRRSVYRFDQISFSIHCHNDLGLALANSITAIAEGATQVHCTVNGIGERAGNVALEEFVAALVTRSTEFKRQVGTRLDQVYPTSRLVRRLTGIAVQPHKPVVGANAFMCETVVPQLADSTENPPYQIINPDLFGIVNGNDQLTSETALSQFQERITELGYDLGEEELKKCYLAFMDLTARKEQVFDADLDLLVNTMTESGEKTRYRLLYLSVNAGSISVPNATVQLEVEGEVIQDAGFGHGPVDAAFKTICRMAKHSPRLVRYELNAVTPGMDAQGEVAIRLEENGHLVSGRGVDSDIVMASAKALVDGLNKLYSMTVQPVISEFTDEESWMPRL
jgi:2-isopropylmalate synthase